MVLFEEVLLLLVVLMMVFEVSSAFLLSAGVEEAKGNELPNSELFGVVVVWDGLVGVDAEGVAVCGGVVDGATGCNEGGRRDLSVTSSHPKDRNRCSR